MATIFDAFSSRAIAVYYSETSSNQIPYLGTGLFPAKKKRGLELSWFKNSHGLPVSLMPTAFDAKATFRDRPGFEKLETEMPFFREAYHVDEKDRQDILQALESNSSFAPELIQKIFDDAADLIEGARVVPERMIFSLLFPVSGDMGISIAANNVTYSYDYDPGDVWKGKNYKALTGTALWTASSTANPIKDFLTAKTTIAGHTGATLRTAIMNTTTFENMCAADSVKNRFLTTNGIAVANMLPADAKRVIEAATGINIIVYDKQYKKEDKTVTKFVPDGYVSFIPEGKLGNTWYGTTPEEADLRARSEVDVSIINTGVALTSVVKPHPVQIDLFASEIVLPSFERMDDVYVLKAHA